MGIPMSMKRGKSKPIDYGLVTCCRRSRNHWCAQPVAASAGVSKAELEGCLDSGCSVETGCRLRSPSISGLNCKTRIYWSKVGDVCMLESWLPTRNEYNRSAIRL